jgi:hypothetical protein
LMIKAFANGRQVTELIESEARSRVIVALRREGQLDVVDVINGSPVHMALVHDEYARHRHVAARTGTSALTALVETDAPGQNWNNDSKTTKAG